MELLKEEWNKNTSSVIAPWQAFHLKSLNAAFWSNVTWAYVPPSPELWESTVCSSPWLGSSWFFFFCIVFSQKTGRLQLCNCALLWTGGGKEQNKNWEAQLWISLCRGSFKPVEGFSMEISLLLHIFHFPHKRCSNCSLRIWLWRV